MFCLNAAKLIGRVAASRLIPFKHIEPMLQYIIHVIVIDTKSTNPMGTNTVGNFDFAFIVFVIVIESGSERRAMNNYAYAA